MLKAKQETVSKIVFKDPSARPLLGLILGYPDGMFVRVRTARQTVDIPTNDIKAISATKQIFRGALNE